jgi:hypothetical protein
MLLEFDQILDHFQGVLGGFERFKLHRGEFGRNNIRCGVLVEGPFRKARRWFASLIKDRDFQRLRSWFFKGSLLINVSRDL